MTDTTDQQAVTVAQDVTNLCRIMAKADGLDWDEVCPYENDCAENLGDVACDSGTCVAAHYEDHDVDVARGRYIGLAKAVLASVSSASAEPFGYWVTQKHADPVLLRKPAYIPEPSDLRTVIPLYASPEPVPATNQAGEVANPIDNAPKDGTMVRLLVDYSDGGGALEDEHPQSWTIGFNNLSNTGEDAWQFAGWSWEQDVFTQGSGTPVGWLPWSNPSTGGDK